jgi:hypothetical protein
MSLVNSPKLIYDSGGARERTPVRAYLVRGATVALVATAVVLALLAWLAGDVVNRAMGRTGTVQGIVLDESGQPLANSEVFLIKAPDLVARTDAQGRFSLANVPTGTHSLIVSVGSWGQEYSVTIARRAVTQAGELTFLTPPIED